MLEEALGNVEEIVLVRLITFGIEMFIDFRVANFIFKFPRSPVYVLFLHELSHFVCKHWRCPYIGCQDVFRVVLRFGFSI